MICLLLWPSAARAQSLLESISGVNESTWSLISTTTKDRTSGTTTKTEIMSYGDRLWIRLNYNILPKLNLNVGGTFEETFEDPISGLDIGTTEITRLRPYIWLSLRDPVLSGTVGYSLADDTTKTEGQERVTLTQDTYLGDVLWRPAGLPATELRYTRTLTHDEPKTTVDTTQDQIYLKSEYIYGGFDGYYAGRYIDTHDNLRGLDATQITHEGRLIYNGSFFDGRVSVVTDNRERYTQITADTDIQGTALVAATALSLPATQGLSAVGSTPLTDVLAPNGALINGDLTTSAGVNIGFQAGDLTLRQVGLNFGTAVTVNRLDIWATGFGATPLPADISSAFAWSIYTSSDNITWTLQTAAATAQFGPFDNRFRVTFPPVTAQYIKAVTRPLPGGIVGSTNSNLFPTIFITEVQAFSDTSGQAASAGKKRFTVDQTARSDDLEVRVILLRIPLLYYRFDANYVEFEPNGQTRYTISNGLFLTHRLSRIFTTSANASFEFGEENKQSRQAVLYYGALTATPLPTLTDSLVVSGNEQLEGKTTTTNNSVILYNTAQLYRGINAQLQLGALFTSNEEVGGESSQRRDLFVNLGTTITPHPALTFTGYYLGKLSRATGSAAAVGDTVEHRLDLGLAFNPFRTLFFTATANILSETGQPLLVLQNYSANWTPFPDGNLQLSFFYSESHQPDGTDSRIIQPTVRWYLSSRHRSYFQATYELNTSDSPLQKTESKVFSTRLNIYF